MVNNTPQTESSLLKNVLIVAPLSLIGSAGTFLIYIVLANWFGDTAEMDFIYYYWAIAVFLIELLSAASAYSVLVPLLAEARAKGEIEAQRCVQSISSLYITIMPGLCCLLVGISYAVSQLFFPGAGLTPSTTIGIVCGFLIFAIVSAIRWMLKAILDTYQAFQLPVTLHGIRAVFVIGTIYLFKPAMAWLSIPLALILGEIFQVLILFPRCCAVLNLRAQDLKISWQETPYAKAFLRQCLLMMGAAIADGLNPVVDRGMGSTLGTSSVSKLDYASPLVCDPRNAHGCHTAGFVITLGEDFRIRVSHRRHPAGVPKAARVWGQAKRLARSHRITGADGTLPCSLLFFPIGISSRCCMDTGNCRRQDRTILPHCSASISLGCFRV